MVEVKAKEQEGGSFYKCFMSVGVSKNYYFRKSERDGGYIAFAVLFIHSQGGVLAGY